MPFEFKDHVADIIFVAHGKTLEELLAEAGRALFAAMLDIDRVQPVVQTYFTVEGKDEEDLLYNFLEELLVYKDADSLAFSRFDVSVRPENGKMIAEVVAEGEKISPEHNPRADVKAISWHGFRVWRDEKGYHAEVLLDL
ncbi:MAG: protein archease [Candidatus Diapherotrites archaeon]|nr:protein archease [Candidatus Diapherotrites archaeon]